MRLNQQRGISLISLMVGTVLSMLTIIAMLALYKNLVQVAVDATQDANHDGGLASALLTAQLELQSAGFGMDEDFSKTIYIHNTGSINAILWYYKVSSNGSKQCAGLIERQHPDEDKKKFRTLTLLQQPDCRLTLSASTAANPDAGWDIVTNLAVLKKTDPDKPLLLFEKSTDKCRSPYNLGTDSSPPTHPQITITAKNSSFIEALKTTTIICLSNISWSD